MTLMVLAELRMTRFDPVVFQNPRSNGMPAQVERYEYYNMTNI
jgi:hypothetical protein